MATNKEFTQAVEHINSLAQKLNALMEKTDKIVEKFEQTMSKDSSFHQASTQLFNTNAVETIKGNYAQLSKHLDDLVTVGKIPAEFQKHIDDYAETLQANKRYFEKVKKAVEDAAFFERFNEATTKLESVITTLNQAQPSFPELAKSEMDSSKKIKESVEEEHPLLNI